jgi:hypothetical protein
MRAELSAMVKFSNSDSVIFGSFDIEPHEGSFAPDIDRVKLLKERLSRSDFVQDSIHICFGQLKAVFPVKFLQPVSSPSLVQLIFKNLLQFLLIRRGHIQPQQRNLLDALDGIRRSTTRAFSISA